MPSNHLLKDLPFVDEDGYFEGVCSVQMGGGISLPANVAEAAVPEDTEHFFYKLNATRDGFDAEKKPTTAAECVACGVISHESCKSSKDHSKPRNEVDTSLKSPV